MVGERRAAIAFQGGRAAQGARLGGAHVEAGGGAQAVFAVAGQVRQPPFCVQREAQRPQARQPRELLVGEAGQGGAQVGGGEAAVVELQVEGEVVGEAAHGALGPQRRGPAFDEEPADGEVVERPARAEGDSRGSTQRPARREAAQGVVVEVAFGQIHAQARRRALPGRSFHRKGPVQARAVQSHTRLAEGDGIAGERKPAACFDGQRFSVDSSLKAFEVDLKCFVGGAVERKARVHARKPRVGVVEEPAVLHESGRGAAITGAHGAVSHHHIGEAKRERVAAAVALGRSSEGAREVPRPAGGAFHLHARFD
ncbi:MAG: hypothetical protein BRD44_01365 [Bacteroidetes bacterium QS_7_67_15]|nr:MAG: hypothetical protein BRD44_01365 [Bacteroidetes bacterium QS_7_67_15]